MKKRYTEEHIISSPIRRHNNENLIGAAVLTQG